MTYKPGPTNLIADEDLASAVARQRLATIKFKEPAGPAVEAIRVGRAVQISATEMQRVTGFSRQTIYNNFDRAKSTSPDDRELQVQVLMVIASEPRPFPASAVAGRLDLPDPPRVLNTMLSLEKRALCAVGPEDGSSSLVARATDETFVFLRGYFESIYLRRPDAYMVSFDARGHDTGDLFDRLQTVLSNPDDVTLMGPEVMPSTMIGPELGFYVYASTVPRVYEIAHKIWQDMMLNPDAVAPIRMVLPPADRRPQPSEILDGFLNSLIEVDPSQADEVTAARDAYVGGAEKVDLAGRCVRQAARAMRRARDIKAEPGRIYDGESAWTEVEIAEAHKLDAPFVDLQAKAKKAVWLASNHLGYFPGGTMASMGPSAPMTGGHPTNAQLLEMAEAAGEAVGEASTLGLLNPVQAMLDVVFEDASIRE